MRKLFCLHDPVGAPKHNWYPILLNRKWNVSHLVVTCQFAPNNCWHLQMGGSGFELMIDHHSMRNDIKAKSKTSGSHNQGICFDLARPPTPEHSIAPVFNLVLVEPHTRITSPAIAFAKDSSAQCERVSVNGENKAQAAGRGCTVGRQEGS